MWIRLGITWILLLLYVSTLNEIVAGADRVLSEEEVKAINTLVKTLVAAGMPDTKDGEYYVGPARISYRFDPQKGSPLLPMRFCSKQATVPDSKKMDYFFEIPGPHFKLSEARWLLGLQFLVSPRESLQISTDEMEVRELQDAVENAGTQYPFEPDQDFDAWFKDLATEHLAEIKEGVKQGVPIWRYFQLPRNDTSLGLCCLWRAGVDDAGVLAYTIADARCRDYWRMHYWSGEDAPFDPTGQYSGMQELAESWHAEGESFPVETPSIAFRRDLHRRFFHLLRWSEEVYPRDITAILARATLDPDDPQHLKKRIDALIVAHRIAIIPPEDADLATKLMSWGEPDADESANFQVTSTGNDQRPGISTVFTSPPPAYLPQRKDLPELFALLGDDRPTRWIDYQGSRSVGENALRAIAIILEKNPLELVDRAALEPWTAERRKEANQELTKWWEANRWEYLNDAK